MLEAATTDIQQAAEEMVGDRAVVAAEGMVAEAEDVQHSVKVHG